MIRRANRLQVSLRGWLVLVTVICVALSCNVAATERQRFIMCEIVRMGGEVDHITPSPDFPWADEAPWFVTFRQHNFLRIDGSLAVAHNGSEWDVIHDEHEITLTDDRMQCVAELNGLGALSLVSVPITDAGLRHLKSAKRLRYLFLSGTDATSAEVTELQKSLPRCMINVRP